jgi:hypothetical protein
MSKKIKYLSGMERAKPRAKRCKKEEKGKEKEAEGRKRKEKIS